MAAFLVDCVERRDPVRAPVTVGEASGLDPCRRRSIETVKRHGAFAVRAGPVVGRPIGRDRIVLDYRPMMVFRIFISSNFCKLARSPTSTAPGVERAAP